MSCQLTRGQIKIWCGISHRCDSHDVTTVQPVTAIPVLSKLTSTQPDPNDPAKTISVVSVAVANQSDQNQPGVYILNPGTYGIQSLEQYGADLNKLKTVAIAPGSKCVINYSIVNTGSPLCDHNKGSENTGFLFVKENPLQIKQKNLLGSESIVPNTSCAFITCDDILNLTAIASSQKNRTLHINTITVETIEHFDGQEILRHSICGVKLDAMYWLLLVILIIYFIYLWMH